MVGTKYSPELREQVLRAIRELGLTQVQAAEKFSVHHKTISRWVHQDVGDSRSTARGCGHVTELAKLRRELDNAYRVIGKLTTHTDRPKG